MTKPIFIAFEGIDGSGKTTQAKLLKKYIETTLNKEVILVQDPGTTQIGKNIRQLLIDHKSTSYIETELFLYLAARSQLVQETIIPALNTNKIVITDRYTLSTEAYQGINSSLEEIISIGNHYSSYNIQPTITYLLDLDIRYTIPRKNDLASLSRLEIALYDEIRERYLKLAIGNDYKILDGCLDELTLHNEIASHVLNYI